MVPGLGNRLSVRFCLLLGLWVAVSSSVITRAEAPTSTKHQMQAAFLFNFANFVTWPEETSSGGSHSFTIGVLGEDPFAAVLEEIINDKTVRDKKLAVKRFGRIQDAVNSHILFLSASQNDHLPHILKVLESTSILTVSDMEQFAERGGMIAFTMEDQKVRFTINVEAAERAGLKIGSQLLKLARIVGDKTRTED